jgi:phosphodiesterase/alkaline phosphatase D-like protein
MSDERRLLPRREFIRLTGAALLVPGALHGCGDDGPALLDTTTTDPGTSSSGSELPTTGGPTGDTSTGDLSSSSSSTSTTAAPDSSSTGQPVPEDMGAPEQVCPGEPLEFDAAAISLDLVGFPGAVMAGSMRSTSFLLTTWSAAPGPKLLRVWLPGERDGSVLLVRELELETDLDGHLQHVIDGLCPGTWYHYGLFTVDEQGLPLTRSILGEVRTPPVDDALEPVTVAVTSCNGIGNAPWPALLRTADEYYDVLLHLGDMAYNDGALTLADYRASWRNYLRVDDGQPRGMALAYSRAGLYCTLDDHEVTNDFNPETVDPQRLQDALQSYFEAVPITDQPQGLRVWRSYRWGRTAEFIILDCRTERLASQGQYIGPEQMAWLKQRLVESPCHFKIVLNSVPITNMPDLWDYVAYDRWEGFPGQRSELLDHIQAGQIRNVWFLSGDLHTCFVGAIQPGSAGVLAKMREVAVTGGNTNVLGDFLPPQQFPFHSSKPHAVLLTFDPEADEVLVRFIDSDTGEDAYAETLTQK